MTADNPQGQSPPKLPPRFVSIVEKFGLDPSETTLDQAIELAKLDLRTAELDLKRREIELHSAPAPTPGYVPIRGRAQTELKSLPVEDWIGLLLSHDGSPTRIQETLDVPYRTSIYRSKNFQIAKKAYDAVARFL